MNAPGNAHVLGIDLGTSGVKVVLVDAQGQGRGEAVAPLALSHPQPLWSEQIGRAHV